MEREQALLTAAILKERARLNGTLDSTRIEIEADPKVDGGFVVIKVTENGDDITFTKPLTPPSSPKKP